MDADSLAIRENIENWVLWRDSGDWERFASLWWPDGRMNATWFQASAADFIARSRRAFDDGMKAFHTLGGSTVDIAGVRAISKTRMQIVQRAPVDGVVVDVSCLGRFWDAWEKRGDKWGLRFRQPIYELDHVAPVDPSKALCLDSDLLASFPEGYRHLAYLQTKLGFDVSKTLPGARGPELEALEDRGRRWLAGEEAIDCFGS